MNNKQFLLATRNVVRLEDLASATAKKVLPSLKQAMEDIAGLIDDLPEGDIMRGLRYKQIYEQMASIYLGPNELFKNELLLMLRNEVEEQTLFAKQFLDAADTTTGVSTVPSAKPPVSVTQTARGTTASLGAVPPTLGPGNYGVGVEITRTQLTALADDVQVLGVRLEELFKMDTGTSKWIQSNINQIDRTVKTGFLTGQTNAEISRAIQDKLRASKAQADAVARTAVMDLSQRAQAKFYDANRDRIAGYEYDAVFDYRVCEQCAPWSGAIRRKRSELPTTPRHPSCRCQRLPLTASEWALRKDDPQKSSSFVDLVPGEKVKRDSKGKPMRGPSGKYVYENTPKPKAKSNEKFYSKPVFVDGKRYWRKRVDAPTAAHRNEQMAEFLRRASNDTQDRVMGVERADKFRGYTREKDRKGNYRYTSQEALVKALPGDRWAG